MVENHLFLKVSGVIYLALMTNFLMVATSLPLVVLLLATDPTGTWPFVAVAAVAAAPSLPATFSTFARYSDAGDVAVVRNYFRAWRRHAVRAWQIGALTVALCTVLAVDIAWAFGHEVGAVAIPVFATLIALVAGVALGGLVAVTERPELRLAALARAATFLMAKRWYLTLMSLAAFVVLLAITAERPAIGLGVVAAPLLYLVWANTRFTLRPILT
ncbi:DUF624 domain-containing protein [Tessaracoccus rhinocerotis]|uniref:DUF624 domain-containing protein n=1 Tax=Tessaracoccus rhinocerotis TaxID=1689449 RepID=A0A553JZL4_9ACTN|nr:DUF624 domain-containing protein [Tessaracoccus rhinocerotis]TRY17890.1 DUF624 domain-containing protein [Tessaracoccus rhinocerotis]